MRCLKPIKVNGNFYNCGYCRNCRVNKTSQWALRLIYELDNWDCASFVTLTYNQENLPKDFGLHKEHLTSFLKALRYDLSLEKENLNILRVVSMEIFPHNHLNMVAHIFI